MTSGKAIVINKHGATDVLETVNDFSIRSPEKGEVLIKLVSTSVNPVDVYVRAGTYASKEFPKVRAWICKPPANCIQQSCPVLMFVFFCADHRWRCCWTRSRRWRGQQGAFWKYFPHVAARGRAH